MATRPVVTRTRRVERAETNEFYFSKEMASDITPPESYPQFLVDYRERAWQAYQQLPIPTTTDEAWRRTDLRSLKPGIFRLPGDSAMPAVSYPEIPNELLKPLAGERHGGQIILGPGSSHVDLNHELVGKGVIFADLETATREHPNLVERILGKVVRPDEGKFGALAAMMARKGVFVYIPPGVEVEQPLHSILWGPGLNLAYFSHILVLVDEGASLTYVHETASPTETDGQTLHCGIVELAVESGANLRFVELQSWGDHVWNFTHERARVKRDAHLDWIFGALGGHLTKNFSDLDLAGQGATGRMSGFYFADGDQHLDLDTQQNHLAPHTTSDLLYKGALRDKSRSVWQGMIYVAPGAQKTDGYQANRNLVLSRQARSDSIPGLEILADDVRCTHGATVGKIDADQVFYLRSRGIPYQDAERLIVEGFFDPIMQRIPFEGVRSRFQEAITEKMG
jgi:Fe-S cluster assembly protein SufD